MARLAHICLAALALMVAVTSAAPCNHGVDHSIGEHHVDHEEHHVGNHNGGDDHDDLDGDEAWGNDHDELEDGDDYDDGDDDFDHDADCVDNCHASPHHGGGELDDGDDLTSGPHHGPQSGDVHFPPHNGGGNGLDTGVDGGDDFPPHTGGGDEFPPHTSGPHHGPHHGPHGGDLPSGRGDDDSHSLVGAQAGYIGTGDINAQGLLSEAVNVRNANIHDLVQGVDVF